MKNSLDKYMKISCGKFHVVCSKNSVKIDCPSKIGGGIGNFSCEPLESMWTGDIHLASHHRISFHFSNITSIETSDDYLSVDVAWKLFMVAPKKFTYKYWFNLSNRIKKLIQEAG